MKELVSVIIPYFKKILYVEKCIQSVLNQTYNKIEILIIYDDDNLYELKKLKKKFSYIQNINFICNNANYGSAYSRNRGIESATGDYCAFLDADDLWEKDKLTKQISFMIKNKLKFSFTAYKKNTRNKSILIRCKKKILRYDDLLNECPIGLSTVILEKKIIPKNLFPQTKTQEDLGAWLKITKNNIGAYYLDEVLTTWTSTPNSLSKNNIQKIKDLYFILKSQNNIKFFNKIYYFMKISLNSLKRKI
jgi:teichuronic acid biosynthesis glycosyltransferase TuaG